MCLGRLPPPTSDRRQLEDWTRNVVPVANTDHQHHDQVQEPDEGPSESRLEGGFKSHAHVRNRGDAAALGPVKRQKPQALQSTRQKPTEAEGRQRSRVRETNTAKNNGESDDLHPRVRPILEHYTATKRRWNAAPAKDQRKFVWDFIKGLKDEEFIAWFQELLLEKLPGTMVHRRAQPSRRLGGETVAFTLKVTWEAVNQVFRKMTTPPFLEL